MLCCLSLLCGPCDKAATCAGRDTLHTYPPFLPHERKQLHLADSFNQNLPVWLNWLFDPFGHVLSISHLIISIIPKQMSGLPGRDRRGTTAVHGAAVIYISPAWRGRSCPVTHRKLSSFIKAPEPEIQPGICCSLPTCGGTSNSNKCKGIHAKKTKLKKKILTLVYIFQVVHFRRHCAAAFQPCKVLLWAFGLTFKLFSQCANLLCVGEITVPQKTHCVLQCGGIRQTGTQWHALQGPTVELMLTVC